jgi:hypothetical protein
MKSTIKPFCKGSLVAGSFLGILAGVFSSTPILGSPSNSHNNNGDSIRITADLNEAIAPVNYPANPPLIAAMTPRLTVAVKRIESCGSSGSKYVEVKARRVQGKITGSWSSEYQVEAGGSVDFRAPDRGFSGDADAPVIEVELNRKQGTKTCSTDSLFYNWQRGEGYGRGVDFKPDETVSFNGITFVMQSQAKAGVDRQYLINALKFQH